MYRFGTLSNVKLIQKEKNLCTVVTNSTVYGGRDEINPHILAIVKSIDSKFGILKVLILTSNATEHFFILH